MLTALDKRLQSHQEAFTLLERLLHTDDKQTDEFLKLLQDCKRWWETHSLYLTTEARKAFRTAYGAAGSLASARARRADWNEMKIYVDEIQLAIKIMEESVSLPSIGALVSKDVDKESNKNDT